MTGELGHGRSAGLDALRIAACLGVVLFHMRSVTGVDFGPLNPLIQGGDTGVFVFFVLSGYLLYKPFLHRKVDLRSYALRRAARILPGYYVALVALGVLTASQLPFEHPLAYLTLSASYDMSTRGFLGPAWTLAAEVLFYVSLPLIARLVAGRELLLLPALAVLSIIGSLVHRYTTDLANVWLNDAFPYVFYAFVPGMLVAALEVRRPNTFRTLGDGRALAAGLLLIGIGAVSSWLPIKIGTLMGAPLVVGWLLNHRVPATRALVFGGGASYALYLWNYDLYFRFGPAGVVIAVIGSVLSWAIVERPILNWAHRRSAHWHIRPIATDPIDPAPKPAAVA